MSDKKEEKKKAPEAEAAAGGLSARIADDVAHVSQSFSGGVDDQAIRPGLAGTMQ